MSKSRKKINILKSIYKKIPNSNCKGLCQEACSIIGFTKLEGHRMSSVSGKQPSVDNDLNCGYLSESKCSVYDHRPAICRLFGSTEKLTCPFGCEPDRMLTEPESMVILASIDALGDHKMYSNITVQQAENLKKGKDLDAPPSSSSPQSISTIVPFMKKD